MKEGAYLIISKQCGLLCGRTSEIHHIHNMRTMIGLTFDILRLEIIHPCSTTLTIPRVEICIINSQELAFFVKDLISSYLGVIHLNLLILLKFQAIETFSQAEYTFLYILQLKVRAEIIVRDRIFLLFKFLGVIAEIPRLYMCGI